MCLAVPAKILKLKKEEYKAKVDYMGARRWIEISLIPEAKEGDYVLVHAGEAIHAIDEEEALKTLEIWEELYAAERKFMEQV